MEVAPRTGAWIETQGVDLFIGVKDVAPRTGAWIETFWLGMLESLK